MAEKLKGPGLTQEKFLALVAELRKADAVKDSAVAECRIIKKRMKSQGVDLDAFALMQSLAKLEPDDAVARMKNLQRYSAWDGSGVQLQLFKADLGWEEEDAPSSATVDEIAADSIAIAQAREAGWAHAQAGGTIDDCSLVGHLRASWIEGFQALSEVPPAVRKASTRRAMSEPVH